MPRPPLILALGNPILTDDRVGLEVGRLLHARLAAGTADFEEASVGGHELLHVLEGYDRVVIVDAVEAGHLEPGEVREIPLHSLERSYAPITPHNAGLRDCLKVGRALDMHMPADLVIFAIGVLEARTLSEEMTPRVAAAVPAIVEHVHARLFGAGGRWAPPVR
jgi:hydrogenase maturation protease